MSLRIPIALLVALALLGPRAKGAEAPAPFGQDALVAALKADLSGHFNTEGDLQLVLLRPVEVSRSVGPDWSLTVLDYPQTPSATMLVRIQVRDGAGVALEDTLQVKASLWRDTWVVRLPLTVGEVFDASRLDTRRSDMMREPDLLPASVGDRGYIFARAVPVGRMLNWHDVARRPLVRKGELVEVTAIDGLLVVTMKAVALETGAQGDLVTVRNTDSRKEFSALVTDENRVQVQF